MARQAQQCTFTPMRLRVLSWNLMHGRSMPSAGRDLLPEFTVALRGWEWDVALLQEVPPWWPEALATSLESEQRSARTSRNGLLALRRSVAIRWPDVIKSNGGGANAIVVRADRIAENRWARLCRLPERRWVHGVRLGCGIWVANLHATVHDDAAAERDGRLAASTALGWAAGAPLVLGGDFNVRRPAPPGLEHAGGHDVDHVFVSGLRPSGTPAVLDRGRLSDHAPVAVEVEWEGRDEEPPTS
jgi:endonuclease/exonuclease/phosphatase family metal-dependent hydrolase